MKIREAFTIFGISLCLSGILALMTTGCALVTAPTAPQSLAPGYNNQADEAMGVTLTGAHNFYAPLETDIASGKYVPAPTERVVLHDFGIALDTAESVYVAYHAGTATEAQAQAAVVPVTTQLKSLQASVVGGVK